MLTHEQAVDRNLLLFDFDNIHSQYRTEYQLDFSKVRAFLLGNKPGAKLVSSTIFISVEPTKDLPEDHKSRPYIEKKLQFVSLARQMGYQVRVVVHKPRYDKTIKRERSQGYNDLHLVCFILKHLDQFDTLLLASHDGDFAEFCAILAENFGKRVELVGFASKMSKDLLNVGHHFHNLSSFQVRRQLEYLPSISYHEPVVVSNHGQIKGQSNGQSEQSSTVIIEKPPANLGWQSRKLNKGAFDNSLIPCTRLDFTETLPEAGIKTFGHLADQTPQQVSELTSDHIGVEKAAQMIRLAQVKVYGMPLTSEHSDK